MEMPRGLRPVVLGSCGAFLPPGQKNPQDPEEPNALPSPSLCQSPGDPQSALPLPSWEKPWESSLSSAVPLSSFLRSGCSMMAGTSPAVQALASQCPVLCFQGVRAHPGLLVSPWALAGRSLSLWLPLPWDILVTFWGSESQTFPELPLHPSMPGGSFLPDFRHLSLCTDDPATPTRQTQPGVPSLQAGGVTEGSTPPSPW